MLDPHTHLVLQAHRRRDSLRQARLRRVVEESNAVRHERQPDASLRWVRDPLVGAWRRASAVEGDRGR